jgi:hypothetical protein
MKQIPICRAAWLLPLNAIILATIPGCATPEDQSFNHDFNQNLPSSPKYRVEAVSDHEFKIRLHQGEPLDGPARVVYLKEAATAVAQDEARRLGWPNWQLDYIQERDQGWMHVLVADVVKKPAVERVGTPVQNP